MFRYEGCQHYVRDSILRFVTLITVTLRYVMYLTKFECEFSYECYITLRT